MGNPLKQLAGETAIYGLSTILARIINFLFVPFYTRLLTTSSYGVVTEFRWFWYLAWRPDVSVSRTRKE